MNLLHMLPSFRLTSAALVFVGTVTLALPERARADAPSCPDGLDMAIVAHADDDIIFMNPTLDDRIGFGHCAVTLYITAGDAGLERSYWAVREAGARAAHALMRGLPPSDWENTSISVRGHSVQVSYLRSRPTDVLIFLRLPDGLQSPDGPLLGPGSSRYGYQSLQKLWSGEIQVIDSVDGASSYTRFELIQTLAELIETYRPTAVHIQDRRNDGSRSDHSDHVHAARFAFDARQNYADAHEVREYLGYHTSTLPVNVDGSDYDRKLDIFVQYALHDPLVHEDGDLNADIGLSYLLDWLPREYLTDQKPPPAHVLQSGHLIGIGDNCLDVVNGGTANHTPVQMYDCVDVPAQRWQLMSNGELRGVGGKCLDVINGGTANQTQVQMYDCVGVAAQRWRLSAEGELIGVGNNCLDVVNGGTANQTQVQMYDCVGVPAQRWRFGAPPQVLRSGHLIGIGGKCLDVVNGGTANQTPVQLYDCVDVPAQRWQLMSNGELRGVGGNCLDVVNGATANQTPVQMYRCNGVPAQRWQLTGAGELRGVGNNCLDVINGDTRNGTRVQMYDCVGVLAQRWHMGTPPSVVRSGQLVGVGENCLDVVGGSTANGAKLQMYDCVDVPAQQFELMSNGELRGVGGNCLDVVGGGTASGTQVQMYRCDSVAAQRWQLTPGGELRGVGGNCLDVINGGTANHNPVQMYDCAGVPAQNWRFR